MAALFTPSRDCKLRPFLTPPMFGQGTHHFAPGSDRCNQRQVLGSLGKFRIVSQCTPLSQNVHTLQRHRHVLATLIAIPQLFMNP